MAFRISIVACKTVVVEAQTEKQALDTARELIKVGDLEIDEIEASEISQKELDIAQRAGTVITREE